MMTDTAHDQATFQAAIALNNMAVGMVERGCFRQGMAALQDGILLVKRLFQSAAAESFDTSNFDTVSSFKLQRAAINVMQPESLFSTSSPAANLDLKTITYQDTSGLSDVLELLKECPSFSRYFLVRMDDCSNSDSPDVASIVLLHNLGVTQMLLSLQCTCIKDHPHFCWIENAHRVLDLASNIIASRSAICCDSLEEATLLQVGLMVLYGIIQILLQSGRVVEAKSVFERYSTVRVVVKFQLAMDWYTALLVTAPAA
jgi:hypothetical protein